MSLCSLSAPTVALLSSPSLTCSCCPHAGHDDGGEGAGDERERRKGSERLNQQSPVEPTGKASRARDLSQSRAFYGFERLRTIRGARREPGAKAGRTVPQPQSRSAAGESGGGGCSGEEGRKATDDDEGGSAAVAAALDWPRVAAAAGDLDRDREADRDRERERRDFL